MGMILIHATTYIDFIEWGKFGRDMTIQYHIFQNCFSFSPYPIIIISSVYPNMTVTPPE